MFMFCIQNEVYDFACVISFIRKIFEYCILICNIYIYIYVCVITIHSNIIVSQHLKREKYAKKNL